MQTVKGLSIVFVAMLLHVGSALAADLYGAAVTDKDAPTSYMRVGIYGDHPTVASVASGSPADKAGVVRGDIVVSINGKSILRSADLAQFSAENLTIGLFDGLKWKTLNIDRMAVEKALQLEASRKAATITAVTSASASSPDDEESDFSPPLRFDDSSLSDLTLNVVTDQSKSLDHTALDTPTRDLFVDPSHDLEGIDW